VSIHRAAWDGQAGPAALPRLRGATTSGPIQSPRYLVGTHRLGILHVAILRDLEAAPAPTIGVW